MASSVSTDETTNYARLCRLLVDTGSKALRDTFDGIHPPADLHKVLTQPPHNATLNTLKTKKIINSSQWGDLFPAVQSSVSSKRFDVTLLMVLLRNICRLAQPATGWDNLPPDPDKSKEANIARIKYYRNTVYGHASQASVDHATFNSCWTAISNAITGLVGGKYEADMENLRVGSMDPVSEEHYKKLLREWKKDEDSVKERLEEIDENVRKGLEQIKGDMGKELEQIKGDMGKGLEQIKGDMGNIGEKLENFMYRTEEMEDEEPRAGNNVNNFDVQVYVSLPITTAMPPNPGLQPRKDLEFFGHDYPGQVIHQVQNLPGSPRLSLSSQNEDNTRQHENQRCENKDSPPVNGTSASTDVESPGYDYPSLVAVTQPPQHRPPLPSLPIENEEDTYYLSLKWQNEDPLPGNGIFVSTGDSDEANSFLENVEQAIKEFDSMNGTTKDEREQCILQLVLPNLEEKWKKSSTNRRKIYIDLVQIGCSRTSPNTVRHSLRQLLRLMQLDNLESGDYNLLGLESIIRLSISSPDAVFKEEGHQERLLRLSVYSQTLALLIIQKCQKWLSSDDITRELLQLRGHLGKSYNQTKDLFHYSMEFITQAIRFLAQKRKKFEKSDVMAFLKECKERFDPHYAGNGELTFIKILKSPKRNKRKWFALHCVIWYLYFKTYNEDTNHRLQTDRQSVLLLRSVIEAYSVGDGEKRSGNDWKFFVLAGSVLSDITMNNINRENRIDACTCLLNLVKKGVWRGILEPLSRQVLLSPDSYVRSLMADALCTEDNSCCAITEGHHIDHLVTKFPALEVNNEIISRSDRCFVRKAVFSGREAVLKVMYVTNQNVRGRMPSDCQQANLRFIREAYFLSRIQRHPNFPILLSYNTETLPYHLITEYESQGNLLQLLQRAHDQHSRLEENLLLQMLINIADALRYLEKLHLVHRSVMAKNVLVGDDNVCRLSGLHSLRPTDWGPLTEAEDVNDDLPLKWKAPECLLEHHYSTASDVWAFGVVMYEVLTLGYSPFGNLSDKDVYNYVTMGGTPPLEAYFEDNEKNLMKQCWEWKRSERISFPKLSSRLKKMNAELKTAGVARRKSRPDLQPSLANPKVTAEREDDTSYTMRKESSRVVEKITAKDILYHEPLKKLSHPNISISLFWRKSSPEIEIISMRCDLGNLKDYVISGRKGGSCERGDLFIFLSQVASALDYLHTEHIVHGNLRAEHVNVVSSKQVQITHLGRSKRLSTRPDEETSKGCWEKAYMPPDSTRWSAPEVISQGQYSHASDVWSFGVLAWEIFAAFHDSNMMPRQTRPYYNHTNDEILQSIKKNEQLAKPLSCPDWVYLLIQECCSYIAEERPPAIALFDCLTCRMPMKSWLMEVCSNSHTKRELHEVCQPEDACHLLQEKDRPRKEDIEKMCLKGFFTKYETQCIYSEEEGYEDISQFQELGSFANGDIHASKNVGQWPLPPRPSPPTLVRETITSEELLIQLNHPHIVCSYERPESPPLVTGKYFRDDTMNLKIYIRSGRCDQGTIPAFLSQVASALNYLHTQHIVHGNLRAENVVVVEPYKLAVLIDTQVQVICLGQPKRLTLGPGEDTSKDNVLQEEMPLVSARWSAPEVISKGRYSHASDAWSFGVLAWELFAAFSFSENFTERMLPHHNLPDHEVGASILDRKLLQKPRSCPDWIDIMIHECWTYQPQQRPPAIALLDCLACRVPRQSWLIQLWLQNHNKEDWPDLNICQPEDACHVLKEELRPRKEDIEKMCARGFHSIYEPPPL